MSPEQGSGVAPARRHKAALVASRGARKGCSMQWPKPPGRSLMSVRGNAAPRGMTAHDRIRLTGPFAECLSCTHDSPGWEAPRPGLAIWRGTGMSGVAQPSYFRIGDKPS